MTSSWCFLSTLNYDARSTTHKVITGCFLLETLYGFVGIHLNGLRTLLHGRIWQKQLRCIVTYNSETSEQHTGVDDGSCTVGKHWPNTLVICAQKFVLQPDCMWLHFVFVTAVFVSHYSWKLRASQTKHELCEQICFLFNVMVQDLLWQPNSH